MLCYGLNLSVRAWNNEIFLDLPARVGHGTCMVLSTGVENQSVNFLELPLYSINTPRNSRSHIEEGGLSQARALLLTYSVL